uniref:Uncharacterized protein n=1 Tax=viral metagenome TaxID=1070528 RepID=A0A6C0CMX1_9ZZZZ
MFIPIAFFIIAANVGYCFHLPSTRYILNVNKMIEDIDSSSESNDTTNRKITIRQYSKIPPRFSPPKKIQWFPFGNYNAPEMLDGSLAGDVGFDPLGYSSSKKTLYWMREAEVKHARLAMLAAVGWPLSELLHKNIAELFQMDSILASGDRAPSIINGGLSSVYASGVLAMSVIIAGYLEGKAMNSGEVFWNSEKPDGYIPGSYEFDPLNLYEKRGNDKKAMETAEIKNGRLAMIAVTMYVILEAITGRPVVELTPFLF